MWSPLWPALPTPNSTSSEFLSHLSISPKLLVTFWVLFLVFFTSHEMSLFFSLHLLPRLLRIYPLSTISKSLVLESVFSLTAHSGWGWYHSALLKLQLLPTGWSLPLDSDLSVIPGHSMVLGRGVCLRHAEVNSNSSSQHMTLNVSSSILLS